MKLMPVLLGASLVANAALVAIHQQRGEGAQSAPKRGAVRAADDAQALRFEKPQGPATGAGAAIAEAIAGDNLERLRDELRASGLDEESVRMIVSVRLWRRYQDRMKALQPAPDPSSPWWKDEDGGGRQTKEQREQSRLLRDEQRAELERLLGKDPRAAETNPWLARQYGYLPSEKREELQRLEQDYNELSSELRRESRGFTLPSDQ